MSVQSNSGSGGSLEGTPSWSQLSTSPTPGLLSQQHSGQVFRAKEGILILFYSYTPWLSFLLGVSAGRAVVSLKSCPESSYAERPWLGLSVLAVLAR